MNVLVRLLETGRLKLFPEPVCFRSAETILSNTVAPCLAVTREASEKTAVTTHNST